MHPLAQRIVDLQHRLIQRRRLVAACSIAATIIAAALVLGLADYLVHFADRGLRIMTTAGLVAAACWAIYRWWYVPSRRRLLPITVARRVEARFPQLRDALASAVEFLGQDESDLGAGSAQLRRHVIAEAQNAVDTLPLDEVVDRRPLSRAAKWLAVAAMAVVVCLAIDARAVGTALVRLVAPLGATEWPRQNHLEFRDPPTRLAAGQTFEVELVDTAGPLPDDVRIEYRTSHDGLGRREAESMTRVGEVMVARRENVEHSFSFRASGGDDDTMAWHDVEVVVPPRLESLKLVAHPPAYTGLSAASAERHLDVLAGTSIEVRGTASEPLSAARILLDDDQAVTAEVGPDKTRQHASAFHVPPGRWLARKSGAYRIELSDADGLAGVLGQWNLRVQPDSAPTINWQRPTDDIYVTPAAVVPIQLAVKDNLAIQSVNLLVERAAVGEGEPSQAGVDRFELYRGPQKVGSEREHASSPSGDARTAEHALDIGAMNLAAGAQLTLEAEAADYRPGVGRTIAPRRVTIITPDEFEARLADRQAQIVRQLEQALATQRTTREDTRRLEIQHRDGGQFAAGDRNALQSAELNQRRVGRMLVDPAAGVLALVAALVDELETNRLPASDTRSSMRQLTDALAHLAAGPLPIAESELTSARKSAELVADGEIAAQLTRSLTTAGGAQDDVIAKLEQLLGELSSWADFRHFARQLAELRQDQIALERTSRTEIGLDTLPLDVRELSRDQRANLNKASAGQDALARRYEKIEQGMDALARQLADEDAAAAGTLADAVDLARRLTISTNMHETTRDLADNRVGVALERESQIAADLEQVLDVLRNRGAGRGQQLVQQLREAEKRLAELRAEAEALRGQIARGEQPGTSADRRQLQQLAARQAELRRQIEQLSRELDRLQADAASRSTQSAAARLNNQPPGGNQDTAGGERPSSSKHVQQAEQDLAEAARQLAERRQEAELDIALELVRRFQAELQEMVTRQHSVIRDTVQLDEARPTDATLTPDKMQKLGELVAAERELAGLAVEHSEALLGLGAVTMSLEDAARRLESAANLLEKRDTGPAAQRAERHALARLEGMLGAFKETAAEAGAKPPGGAGAGGQTNQQRRPTFELLEVKMLRMLQADLNERTRAYEEQVAADEAHPDARREDALNREARQLAAEQRRLAGLVREMLSRNNKQVEE